MAHLLLIHDDPDLLPERVRHLFPALAHQFEVAHTGGEGLECIASALPDVILLDLRLPDQSGLSSENHIRSSAHLLLYRSPVSLSARWDGRVSRPDLAQ